MCSTLSAGRSLFGVSVLCGQRIGWPQTRAARSFPGFTRHSKRMTSLSSAEGAADLTGITGVSSKRLRRFLRHFEMPSFSQPAMGTDCRFEKGHVSRCANKAVKKNQEINKTDMAGVFNLVRRHRSDSLSRDHSPTLLSE